MLSTGRYDRARVQYSNTVLSGPDPKGSAAA
jgi:hypothetical protein